MARISSPFSLGSSLSHQKSQHPPWRRSGSACRRTREELRIEVILLFHSKKYFTLDSVLINGFGQVDDLIALLDKTLSEWGSLDIIQTVTGAEEDLLLAVLHTLEVVFQ